MIVEKCSSYIGRAMPKAFPCAKRQLAEPTDHIHISHKRGKSKHDRHQHSAWPQHQLSINSRPPAHGRRRAVCTAERFDHSRSGGRRRLPIERHTQGHPLSVPFNREHVGRSQSAVDDADGANIAFFNLSLRKCARYVCNTPAAPSKAEEGGRRAGGAGQALELDEQGWA